MKKILCSLIIPALLFTGCSSLRSTGSSAKQINRNTYQSLILKAEEHAPHYRNATVTHTYSNEVTLQDVREVVSFEYDVGLSIWVPEVESEENKSLSEWVGTKASDYVDEYYSDEYTTYYRMKNGYMQKVVLTYQNIKFDVSWIFDTDGWFIEYRYIIQTTVTGGNDIKIKYSNVIQVGL